MGWPNTGRPSIFEYEIFQYPLGLLPIIVLEQLQSCYFMLAQAAWIRWWEMASVGGNSPKRFFHLASMSPANFIITIAILYGFWRLVNDPDSFPS
ncbi:hypothetical protein CC78DRAFT_533965 [Lojkania enalia]|uniref:Uncharacterized protein n=1 Tax=Lojkania enalia TaxID=147567 RepID=A0A9P4K7K6_9PLEO|nr:hypothetical protein CC78DRAFT_533965 [Didymosphaeria enalia]